MMLTAHLLLSLRPRRISLPSWVHEGSIYARGAPPGQCEPGPGAGAALIGPFKLLVTGGSYMGLSFG